MKHLLTIIFSFVTICSVFGQSSQVIFKEKGKIGLPQSDDKFTYYKFLEGGKKVVLVGGKGVATWDLENLKMLDYFPYNVQEYYPVGKTGMILSFGIAALLKQGSVEIDPNGKWFAAIEGKKEERKSVLRNLQTGEKIAELSLPYPIESISNIGDYFVAWAKKEGEMKIGVWDNKTFTKKTIFAFNDYKWDRILKNSGKLLIGLGKSNFPWLSGIAVRSGNLALYDLQTGKIEKLFTASNLIENDFFYDFQVTGDEKHLIARRDKRVFVWEVNGDGLPKLEIAPKSLKGKAEISEIVDDRILTVNVDNTFRVINFADSPNREYELPTFSDPNLNGSMNFVKKGNSIFYTFAAKSEAVLYDLDNNKSINLKANPLVEGERFESSAFIKNEKYWVVSRFKKPEKTYRTEFYDAKTGKLEFEVPYELGNRTDFTADGNFLYTERIGNFYVWNRRENRYYQIPLKFSSSSCPSSDDPSYSPTCSSETSNDEDIKLTPDQKYFIKYRKNQTVIYDIETGKEVQQLFDSEKVKYDKFNKIKDSGIGKLRFMPNGMLTNADSYYTNHDEQLNSLNYCYNCRSFTFWETVNK
jgi:hypothetical protein